MVYLLQLKATQVFLKSQRPELEAHLSTVSNLFLLATSISTKTQKISWWERQPCCGGPHGDFLPDMLCPLRDCEVNGQALSTKVPEQLVWPDMALGFFL